MLFRKWIRRSTDCALYDFAALNQLHPRTLLLNALESYCRKFDVEDDMVQRLFDAFAEKKLWYEDALLYMLTRVLMGEIPPRTDILHIVLDEAQDYSPVQLFIIKRLFPQSSFTILADIYQTVNSVSTVQSYDAFMSVFGEDTVSVCLEKCYRSSSDINALAFQLIDSREHPVKETYSYFERPVKKPEYLIKKKPFAELRSLLRELEQYNTAAVITDSIEEAIEVQRYLRRHVPEMKDVQLIQSAEDRIAKRVVIIPLLFAKGLEFDGVILLNLVKANTEKEDLRRKVYLGCTRALHALYLLEEAALPESLEDCMPYLNVRESDE